MKVWLQQGNGPNIPHQSKWQPFQLNAIQIWGVSNVRESSRNVQKHHVGLKEGFKTLTLILAIKNIARGKKVQFFTRHLLLHSMSKSVEEILTQQKEQSTL